jgi:isopentenyldiphosphate isomerase
MKIQIVDQNDKLISIKDRDEVDYSKDIYRVAALWLTNLDGEVLIARRKLTKDKDPGLWGPAVAGTIEEGETYESNIYKEADEEIGLTEHEFKVGPKLFIQHPRTFFSQWFFGVCDWPEDKFKTQDDEVEKVEWVNAKQLKQDVQDNPAKYVSQMPLVTVEFT